jgi:respiratory burst oxidase
LLIDGPYGAAAQDYWKYDVLLLVGLGIGATPLVSIIKDTVNNYRAKKNKVHDPESLQKGSKSDFVTERAYFYWVTREEGSLEWFRGLMDDASDQDNEGIIELHNHCTSVYERGDARSALLVMLQELYYAKHEIDILGQTRVRTHFARPNWNQVFKNVAQRHPNKRIG